MRPCRPRSTPPARWAVSARPGWPTRSCAARSADALRLVAPIAVNQLPGFADGALSVQDLSAQCAADALAPASGARVLDACAAPGGKSAHLLERDPSLRLLALDIDARRLARARDTYTRTGVGEGAQTRV